MIACQKGFIELVTEIIEKGAWVNHGDNDNKTPLHYAIDNKAENCDVVNLLVKKNADINKETTSDGFTPLILAVKRGHKNICKFLIEEGAKLESFDTVEKNTALHIAC
jgi:ankyrin repeat protein